MAAGLTRSLDMEAMAAAIPPEGLVIERREEVESRRLDLLGASVVRRFVREDWDEDEEAEGACPFA